MGGATGARRARLCPALLLLVALSTSGCSAGRGSPSTGGPVADGVTCGRVEVPGHEGVDVRATGLDCAAAAAVIRGAEGRGRSAYESDGFACTPSPAPDGDTFYDCLADAGKRITFRYGTA